MVEAVVRLLPGLHGQPGVARRGVARGRSAGVPRLHQARLPGAAARCRRCCCPATTARSPPGATQSGSPHRRTPARPAPRLPAAPSVWATWSLDVRAATPGECPSSLTLHARLLGAGGVANTPSTSPRSTRASTTPGQPRAMADAGWPAAAAASSARCDVPAVAARRRLGHRAARWSSPTSRVADSAAACSSTPSRRHRTAYAFTLHTGAHSAENLRMYKKAGYRLVDSEAPIPGAIHPRQAPARLTGAPVTTRGRARGRPAAAGAGGSARPAHPGGDRTASP